MNMETNLKKTTVTAVIPRLLAISALALLACSVSWAADDNESGIAKRLDNSSHVLNEIMGTPDKAIPNTIMEGAKCIAVVPSMVKIAVGFGGNHGRVWPRAAQPTAGAPPRPSPSPAAAGVCSSAARRWIS